MKISKSDIHHHLKTRMHQRGITFKELKTTINKDWAAEDVKEGTFGKTFVFTYNSYWEDRFYEEKEVTVYYKIKGEKIILLTARARYGKGFKKGVE